MTTAEQETVRLNALWDLGRKITAARAAKADAVQAVIDTWHNWSDTNSAVGWELIKTAVDDLYGADQALTAAIKKREELS